MFHLIGSVKNSQLMVDRKLLSFFLDTYDGKKVLATFEQYLGKKTKQQLGYFFAGIVEEGRQKFGISPYLMKEWLKQECAPIQATNLITGEFKMIGESIAEMDKMRMMAFMDSCIDFLAKYNVKVKSPDEYWTSREGLDFNQEAL
jgi:hypothetical protein